jgi:hypothetical protein
MPASSTGIANKWSHVERGRAVAEPNVLLVEDSRFLAIPNLF